MFHIEKKQTTRRSKNYLKLTCLASDTETSFHIFCSNAKSYTHDPTLSRVVRSPFQYGKNTDGENLFKKTIITPRGCNASGYRDYS